MNRKQAIVIVIAILAGALGRDLFVGRVQAEEDAIRRNDVTSIVRALETMARATEKQADASRAIASEVREAGRNCK